jgi:serine/threonine/tyrosine protein kinase RAD53
MDFDDSFPEDAPYTYDDPQTQSTQQASQHQEDLESHLWGALMPCNTQITRVDLWKIQASYSVGRNPTGNQVVFPGPKISELGTLPIAPSSSH